MRTTIGLGVSTAEDCRIFDDLKILARRYGYGLLKGIEFAELDVRSGLLLMRNMKVGVICSYSHQSTQM